ncbi:MAG: alkaline phosphatase family protein [Acidobacteriota bacterium]
MRGTWVRNPFVQRVRWLMAGLLGTGLLAGGLVAGCGGGGVKSDGPPKRVIVLGIDGMDHGLTRQYMDQGVMPNFSRLEKEGSFNPLGTSAPPLSPVAWSNFITGLDSGGHGIFDFIHRDPETMIPYLSTTRTSGAGRSLTLGDYQIPLSGGEIELMRRGEAFWEVLERNGVESSIIRMPANFPPTGAASRELSGMGTPDILGTYGTFSFYTSVLFAFSGQNLSGGEVYEAWAEDNVVETKLYGPDNPFLVETEKATTDMTFYLDPEKEIAKLVVGNRNDDGTIDVQEERLLEVGEWSDWVTIDFELIPTQTMSGIARFYLRSIRPEFELYVSPINFDPMAPGQPISYPPEYAEELARETGLFYTQGMPEDTQSLREEVLTHDEFMAQAKLAGADVRRQYEYVLDQFQTSASPRRLLFYYFGNLDQISHMMFRVLDPEHPTYDPELDTRFSGVIEDVYRQADEIIGYTLDQMDEDTLLVVMSDHGFASLRRTFSINTWLKEAGYLVVRNPNMSNDPGMFVNIDWARTRAYGVGLNGLYINLKGREPNGIVTEQERPALMQEIAKKIVGVIDPVTGQPAVGKAYQREKFFEDRGEIEIGPDIVIGFAKGTGGSGKSALGAVPQEMFEDNTEPWTGDHGMDHETVPGILLTNRPLEQPAPRLQDLAGAILAEFGIEGFPFRNEPAAQ